MITAMRIRLKKFQRKNPSKGHDQSKKPPKSPPIVPKTAPNIPAIIPNTAPNTPAIIPKSPPARPTQMGKLNMINKTIKTVEVELLDVIAMNFKQPYQKSCMAQKRLK
jgi:hypothetical protein